MEKLVKWKKLVKENSVKQNNWLNRRNGSTEEMVKLENWLNRKMVKWKNGKMEKLVKQKTWLKGKIH